LVTLGLLAAGCGGPKSPPSTPDRETPSSVASSESASALSSSSAKVPSASPERGDWMILRLQAEPDTLNPIVATDAYEREANLYVMEQLVTQNPRTLQYDPMLAESWEETEDHLSYTFHLRKDVRWHNGQPFNADDVIYSYNTIMNPQVRCAHIRNYYNDVEKLEKLDDYTLRFVMTTPFYTAFESVGGMPIVAKSVFDTGEDFNTHPAGRAPSEPGLTSFVEWKTNQEIVIERNPDWWGYREAQPGYVDRMSTASLPIPLRAANSFRRGNST
jgi:peptide/nickel transport system substrate-binding protein